MSTDTPTAQQLWDQTKNYRREGGPGMPNNMEYWEELPTQWVDGFGDRFSVSHAAAILRDHGDEFLIQGKHSPEYGFSGGEYHCQIKSSDHQRFMQFRAKTKLEVINAGIGAVLDEKEGEVDGR